MDCPKCGGKTAVLETRYNPDAFQIKRRRACRNDDCGNRFTTIEKVAVSEDDLPQVIKKDGRRERFDEKKLADSLKLSLAKRSVASDAVAVIINKLQQRLLASSETEIDAKEIGLFVMRELRELDEVAYIRFASVYRNFKDTGTFKSEIDKMSKDDKSQLLPNKNQLKLFKKD